MEGCSLFRQKRNKLSKKGSSEKDQVRERVPRVPRVSGKFWKASKRQSDMEKVKLKEKKSDKEKRDAKESRHSKSSIKRGSAE